MSRLLVGTSTTYEGTTTIHNHNFFPSSILSFRHPKKIQDVLSLSELGSSLCYSQYWVSLFFLYFYCMVVYVRTPPAAKLLHWLAHRIRSLTDWLTGLTGYSGHFVARIRCSACCSIVVVPTLHHIPPSFPPSFIYSLFRVCLSIPIYWVKSIHCSLMSGSRRVNLHKRFKANVMISWRLGTACVVGR